VIAITRDEQKEIQTKFSALPEALQKELKDGPEKSRQEVIYEIIETEKDYVRDLEIMIDLFVKPLKDKNILEAQDISKVFNNIEVIVNVNRTMLNDLEDRIKKFPYCKSTWRYFYELVPLFKNVLRVLQSSANCTEFTCRIEKTASI